MIEINFSVFAEPIKTQLENQGYMLSDKESEKFQKIAKSINMCGFHVATDSQVKSMFKKLIDKIQESATKIS